MDAGGPGRWPFSRRRDWSLRWGHRGAGRRRTQPGPVPRAAVSTGGSRQRRRTPEATERECRTVAILFGAASIPTDETRHLSLEEAVGRSSSGALDGGPQPRLRSRRHTTSEATAVTSGATLRTNSPSMGSLPSHRLFPGATAIHMPREARTSVATSSSTRRGRTGATLAALGAPCQLCGTARHDGRSPLRERPRGSVVVTH